MIEELKPCKCGSRRIAERKACVFKNTLYRRECLSCGKATEYSLSREGAVRDWNAGRYSGAACYMPGFRGGRRKGEHHGRNSP